MTTTLEIQNLKCGGCANTIIKKLSSIKGIENVLVNAENHQVTFSSENTDLLPEVKRLLNTLGYPAKGDKNALTTKAKSFVSCAVGRMGS